MFIEFLKIMAWSTLAFVAARIFYGLVDPAFGANYSPSDATAHVLALYVAHLMHERKKGKD